jgi:hypothetical protein
MNRKHCNIQSSMIIPEDCEQTDGVRSRCDEAPRAMKTDGVHSRCDEAPSTIDEEVGEP